MYSFPRSLSQRYVSSSPPPNRTGGFHRIRLSPFGPSPGTCSKRPFPFPQHTPYIPGGQLARSLSTFGPVFPKAGGLRHQSSSWCARLSHTPTTMPPLTSQEGIGFSYGSRLPTSTILPILPGISRVPTVGLQQDAVGGVFPYAPSALCGSRDCSQGRVRLTCDTLSSPPGLLEKWSYSFQDDQKFRLSR
jgi:hypothetical protein